MEWLLRHNFWLVKLMGLVIVTALVANTTTTGLGLTLLSSSDREPDATEADGDDTDDGAEANDDDDVTLASAATSPSARANTRVHRAERTAERILGYSPFCPTCGPTAPPTLEDPGAIAASDDLSGARRSPLPLVVAATMEAEDPTHSLATLVDVERGVGGLYGVGDTLGHSVEIVRVATGVVHILNAGQLEYIPFDGLPPPDPKAAPKPSTNDAGKDARNKDKAAKSRSIPGAEEAIACTDKGDCTVERAFVEQLIAQPGLLVGQGGAAPATTKDGAPGFRLRGVRKGTLPDLLGLRSGDVITEVGGTPLTMEAAMGLYGKLRHASHIEVTLDRRGKRMTRQLSIRS